MASEHEARDPGTSAAPTFSIADLLKDVQTALAVIAGVAAVFTATGFVIVHGSLARYGDWFSYRFSTTQYIAASLSFLLITCIPAIIPFGFLWLSRASQRLHKTDPLFFLTVVGAAEALTLLAVGLMRQTLNVAAFAIVGVVFALVAGFAFYPRPSTSEASQNAPNASFLRRYALVFLAFGFFGLGALYGRSAYLVVPRFLGGGQATPVQVLWSQDLGSAQVAVDKLFPLTAAGDMPELCLLAELSEGLLLYNPASQDMVAVRNDDAVLMLRVQANSDLDCSPPAATSISGGP